MMKYFLLLMLIIQNYESLAKIDVKELRCLVCDQSIEELNKIVSKIDPTKTVDVGGYRLDVEGNYNHKSVSQAKSELHISEIIEKVCDKMDDFVRATWKSNGSLTLFSLMTEDGKMNPAMSDVDLIQDDDLNKSLKYYCESIMEEYEDDIIKYYQTESSDIQRKVCVDQAKLCLSKKSTNQNVEL